MKNLKNFQVKILFTQGDPLHTEAQDMKEIRSLMRSEKRKAKNGGYPKGFVVQAHIKPKTALGKQMLHKNWAVMNPCGKVMHYYGLEIGELQIA